MLAKMMASIHVSGDRAERQCLTGVYFARCGEEQITLRREEFVLAPVDIAPPVLVDEIGCVAFHVGEFEIDLCEVDVRAGVFARFG